MPSSSRVEAHRRRSGVALVGVLWLLVLLSLIALSLSAGSRTELQLAGNARLAASARHVAEAGVNWGIWSLMQANTSGWLADGSSRTLELDGISVEVALFDEQGKIDLNEADPELLVGLFESVGWPRRRRGRRPTPSSTGATKTTCCMRMAPRRSNTVRPAWSARPINPSSTCRSCARCWA